VGDEHAAEQLVAALSGLEDVADALTPDDAVKTLDNATLQMFWKNWPDVSSWAGALWRKLNEDLASPARPPQDPELDEVGESG
jgi:hypothetical protein